MIPKRVSISRIVMVNFILLQAIFPSMAVVSSNDEGNVVDPTELEIEYAEDLHSALNENLLRAASIPIEGEHSEQEEVDALVVLASFSPAIADPGDTIRIVVEIFNQGSSSYENLVFEDSLEDGFSFIKPFGSNVVYDKTTGKIISRIESLKPGDSVRIQYLLRLEKEDLAGPGEMRIHQVVVQDQKNDVLAMGSASLWVGVPTDPGWESVQVATPGNWISMGRVSLQFDEQESRSNVAAVLSEVTRTEGGPDFQFEVSLFETETISFDGERNPNEQRSQIRSSSQLESELPVRMEVDFTEIMAIDELPPGKSPYIATYDEEAEVWVKVPIETIDFQRNTVRVQAAHFSTWGAGIGDELPQNGANVLLFDEPYVSMFTG